MTWWVHAVFESQGMVAVLSWIFWVLLSITLHELAHGWAAIWEGDLTPIETGHMSANPVVHMGGFSLIVFALIGIAWGMMPVAPWRFRHRRWGDAIVAAAGPVMNLALAFVCLTTLGVWARVDPSILSTQAADWQVHVQTFLMFGGWLNLVLCALNLLPVPPLDGSRLLAACSRTVRGWYQHPNANMVGLALFFFLIVTNAFDRAFIMFGMMSARYVYFIETLGAS